MRSLNLWYVSTRLGCLVIFHICTSIFPVFVVAQLFHNPSRQYSSSSLVPCRMPDPGRVLYAFNFIRSWKIASLSARILAEITHNQPFLLIFFLGLYSLSDHFSDKMEYYTFCSENTLVGVVFGSYWIDLFPLSHPCILTNLIP